MLNFSLGCKGSMETFFSKRIFIETNLAQVIGTPASLNLSITLCLVSIPSSPASCHSIYRKSAIIQFYQGLTIPNYPLVRDLLFTLLYSSSESSTLFISNLYSSSGLLIVSMNLHSSRFRLPTDFFILYSLLFLTSSFVLIYSVCSSSSSPSSLSSGMLAMVSPALIFFRISISLILQISNRFCVPLYNTHFFVLFNYILILNNSIFKSPINQLSIRFISLNPWACGQSSENLKHLCLKW